MPPSTSHPDVLVVDDDPSLRRALRRALELNDFRVREAGSAQEARAACGEAAPDLVIMDLILPGMPGNEAANLLRATLPDLPVLFVSGYTSQESLRLGHLSRGQAFLRKPFEVAELLSAVRAALE